MPNPLCAAQCVLQLNNYSACYNACNAGPVAVQVPPSVSTPTVIPFSPSSQVSGPSGGSQTYPSTGGSSTSTSGSSASTTPGTFTVAQTPFGPITATNPFATVNWQDIGIRTALFIGGAILVILGIVKLFTREPVPIPGTLKRRGA